MMDGLVLGVNTNTFFLLPFYVFRCTLPQNINAMVLNWFCLPVLMWFKPKPIQIFPLFLLIPLSLLNQDCEGNPCYSLLGC